MANADVIVVGLGAMGAAAIDHLAGRGVSVLGIERFENPHALGSSGGDTRLIRKAYFEHPDYVPLLERAYANWRALETDTGESLLHGTGTVYLGYPDGELIAGSLRSASTHGIALEEIGPASLAREFPQFHCPPGYVALYEPEAGFLLSERAVAAQVARARSRGARVAAGERVLDWQADGRGVRVITDRGHHQAGGLVLAAGSWSGDLVDCPGLELRVTRQPMFWVRPPYATPFGYGRSPCWVVQRPDRPGLFYGIPDLPAGMASRPGVKLAHHAPGEVADPEAPRRPADLREFEALLDAVTPFLPGLAGPLGGAHVCTYTLSDDTHFVIDVHPRHPNVVIACGFSGHGFKFSSVVGEVLADLAITGESPLPVAFLKLARR
ncbi:MAG: N-methyl-L-tryptophan oxidase [Pseudomonadota bacterium]